MNLDLMSTFNYSDFFNLGDPLARRALRLEPGTDTNWLDYEIAYSLAEGKDVKLKSTPRFYGYIGKDPKDFLWTGFSPLFCITERVVDLLEENKFTGWSTYSVEVYDRSNSKLLGYYGFAVTGRGGEFKREASSVVRVEHSGGGSAKVYKGYYFDPNEWDQSSIFFVSGRIVVTKEVQKAFKKAKVSNIKFTPLTEVETPTNLFKE